MKQQETLDITFAYKLSFLESINKNNLKEIGIVQHFTGLFNDVVWSMIGGRSHEVELNLLKKKFKIFFYILTKKWLTQKSDGGAFTLVIFFNLWLKYILKND